MQRNSCPVAQLLDRMDRIFRTIFVHFVNSVRTPLSVHPCDLSAIVSGEGSAVVCLCTIDSCSFVVQCSINQMDASLLEELIAQNKPFKIETASGRLFEVPHRDFVSFSTRKTSLIISCEENSTEHFAIVPLLTITAAMARA